MGLRFRKSFRIAPGVRLNLSKSGVGMSVGVKGFRVGVNAKGKTYTTISVPGTGLSHTSYSKRSGSARYIRESNTMGNQVGSNPQHESKSVVSQAKPSFWGTFKVGVFVTVAAWIIGGLMGVSNSILILAIGIAGALLLATLEQLGAK